MITAPMKAAPAIADRIMPSQMGGSGSFMCVVCCAGGGTQRVWLGRLDDVSALVFQDFPLGMDTFAIQSLNCRYGICVSSDLRKSDAIEVAF